MADPTIIVQETAEKLAEASTGFFSKLIHAPGYAVKSAWNALGGLAKGVWGSVMNGAIATVGITGFKLLLPEAWRGGLYALGGEKAAGEAMAAIDDRGIPGIITTSAKEGFGLAAAWGGFNGMLDAGRNHHEEPGSSIGTFLGTGVVIAAVSAVAIGAIHHSGLSAAEQKDSATPKQPSATPAKAPVTQAPGRIAG